MDAWDSMLCRDKTHALIEHNMLWYAFNQKHFEAESVGIFGGLSVSVSEGVCVGHE